MAGIDANRSRYAGWDAFGPGPGPEYPEGVKYFVTYTALRLALFIACWALLAGIGAAVFGSTTQVGIWSFVLGAVLSSILSLRFLAGPRERFAQSVEARAARAAARMAEMKSREDVD